MAFLTNHFCRFPLLQCGGAPPPSFLEHVCVLLFHFWVRSTLVLFVPFWLFASFYSRFLYFFLRIVFHILTGWLKNLNSVLSVTFLFSLAVWISLLLRREGFLTDWWDCYVLFLFDFCGILDFFSVFSLCYCVAKGMFSSLIYCQKLCFSKTDPLSYLVFKSPTLTCFQCVGIPLYCCGHNFCLVSSKYLVPLYSFLVLHKPFSSCSQTRLPVEGNSAGILLGFPWQTIWRLCYSLYC